MNILLINPNTSVEITEKLSNAALRVKSADTNLICETARYGVPYISTRSEALIGGTAMMEILAEKHDLIDAAIVAAFGDPGLGAARELFDVPVIGLAEAGMLTACMLGGRFSIVSFSETLRPWYLECVAWHRLEARCASVRTLTGGFQSIGNVQEEKEDLLVALAQAAITEDDADVIVLAGAPLAGLAQKVQGRIPVPVVDCAEAAMAQAETLARLNVRAPIEGSFRRPVAKPTVGMTSALAERIAGAR
ncbi:aspartate/glutamate racemase family protein [uncultured Thalassospira sp.]|uniref:aspartate/glutamate racemase family protein n=1 Tax=uncultured Thalassospira sp. TaxID=404382 RepID=UPI0030D9226F|tara:strand:+ start:7891 stop:8637 length:747 start_codon:yes stop_codon:yes gene_type:complete